MEKKKWYKSKIILLMLTSGMVVGGDLLFKYLTGQGVTPEQIAVISDKYPDIAANIDKLQNGASWLEYGGLIIAGGVAIIRRWFTSSTLF